MVRWLRWHCPPDTGFEIRTLAVWGRARYLSVTEAPHNTNFHTWMGKKQFCFFQTAETGNRTPDSGVKGSGANHYPRAPAQVALIPTLNCSSGLNLMSYGQSNIILIIINIFSYISVIFELICDILDLNLGKIQRRHSLHQPSPVRHEWHLCEENSSA